MDLSAARILVANDDGIQSEGLAILEKIARSLSDDVWVVAPETEQSGVAHSLTLHQPVRVRRIDEQRFAVSGTPTDCVLLALKELVAKDKKVSLVLSGINRGSNVGDDVTYSGTIAAAMEGTQLGVPSIALSQLIVDDDHIDWSAAERHAPDLICKLVAQGWPPYSLLNLNFPRDGAAKVKGIRVCPQGKRKVNVNLTSRLDPKGRPYYWLGGERENTSDRADVDIVLLEQGYITVTPLGMDLTDYKTMDNLSGIAVD